MSNPTRRRIGGAAGRGAALLLGAAAAFFVVFNAVSSDVQGPGDRVWSSFLTFAVYVGLGFLFGAAATHYSRHWEWWLVAPAIVLIAASSLRELGRFLFIWRTWARRAARPHWESASEHTFAVAVRGVTISGSNRDRGAPHGAAPPTPPGIRVTYQAVRAG